MPTTYHQSSTTWAPSVILFLVIGAIPIALFYKSYLKLSFHVCYSIVAAAMVMAFLATDERIKALKFQRAWTGRSPQDFLVPTSCLLFYLFTAALVIRLFRAWFFNDLRAGQEKPGSDGTRAWFSTGNLVCVIGMTITGSYGFGYPLFALGLVGALALVARPMLSSGISELAPPENTKVENSGETERERILRLLEEGKIDADGAADLLNALGAAGQTDMTKQAPTMTSKQKLALAGGILILIGFLLPWFSLNLGKELSRVTGALNNQVSTMMPQMPGGMQMNNAIPNMNIKTGSMKVSGSEIGKGLGWIVLVCGVAAATIAAMPQLIDDDIIRRNLLLVALGLGAATLFYLFGSSLRHATYGIAVVVGGYCCAGVGAVEAIRKAR